MLSLLEAIRPTTLIKPQKLRDHLRLDITLASETFQHTGSFKFRAAYNVAMNIPNDEVIGVSSGNFGQALAYACRLTGKKCTVVMPHNSAQVKVDAVRQYGAVADLINVSEVSRSQRIEQLSDERPEAYIASAYDDQFVIDGNSTLGDELAALDFDTVIIPVGGGGLISGTLNSFQRKGVRSAVYGAEPLMANDAARSLRAGEVIANEVEPQTIADGTRTLSLGKLNWPIVKAGATDIIEVSEENIAESLRMHYSLANLKVEPTAALTLGAILEDLERFRDQNVCLVVTGANVDADVYARLIAGKANAA